LTPASRGESSHIPFDFAAVCRKKLTVDFAGGNQSSDGGLLLLQQAERKLAACARLATAMPDRRDASCVEHETLEMVTARVSAVACGHKDAIGSFGSLLRSQRLDERE
jgi:hypothetical protein